MWVFPTRSTSEITEITLTIVTRQKLSFRLHILVATYSRLVSLASVRQTVPIQVSSMKVCWMTLALQSTMMMITSSGLTPQVLPWTSEVSVFLETNTSRLVICWHLLLMVKLPAWIARVASVRSPAPVRTLLTQAFGTMISRSDSISPMMTTTSEFH